MYKKNIEIRTETVEEWRHILSANNSLIRESIFEILNILPGNVNYQRAEYFTVVLEA